MGAPSKLDYTDGKIAYCRRCVGEHERQDGAVAADVAHDGGKSKVSSSTRRGGGGCGRADDGDAVFLPGDGHCSGGGRSYGRRHRDKVVPSAGSGDPVTVLTEITSEIQSLRDKVSALEMDNRMYGVVRYPMGYTYSAGASPFCSGCCNGNI